MHPTQTPLFRLSQGQLNLLEACPRKFQHQYFEQLGSPRNPEDRERLMWGSRFHLLMQQRELGLPVDLVIQEDPQLQRWVASLVDTAPEILTPQPEQFRESEHCRTLQVDEYLLTVIYDLLIADKHQAQILDWKTYPQPKHRRGIEKNWQTRLYLYLLVETSEYAPEQISMTYWFVQSQPQPQSLKFTYDRSRHEQTRQDLNRLLRQLAFWLEAYRARGEDFPQVSESSGNCERCNFSIRCDRSPEGSEAPTSHFLTNLADIEEVVL